MCVYIERGKKKMGVLIFFYIVWRNVKGNFIEREKNVNDKNLYFDY